MKLFLKSNLAVFSILVLSSCATQAPVSVVDGYSANPERRAFQIQSEAILLSQQEERYYVQAGDKVSQISKHFGVREEAILARNNISKGADLKEGSYIVIPSPSWQSENAGTVNAYRLTDKYKEDASSASSATSGVQSTQTAAVPAASAQAGKRVEVTREHILQPGETVYRISQRYNVSQFDILAINNIRNPEDLKPGMVIKVPQAGEQITGAEVAVPSTTQRMRPNVGASGAVSAQSTPTQTPTTVVAAPAVSAPAAVGTADDYYRNLAGKYGKKSANSKGFIWPAEGSLLKTFGSKGGGVNNSGIAIALPLNAPIYASENGTVIYSDNGLELYGNLILIRHEGGFVTAYAHNAYNLVKRHQKVAKGDLIGFAGTTGNVEQPQLHFEIRRNAQPVDPVRHLPAR